jgi:hypothetical protein
VSLAEYIVYTNTNVRVPSNTDAPNPVISSAIVYVGTCYKNCPREEFFNSVF